MTKAQADLLITAGVSGALLCAADSLERAKLLLGDARAVSFPITAAKYADQLADLQSRAAFLADAMRGDIERATV